MKGLQLSDPFCVKAAAGDVSQRTCHSLIRKAGVEKEEEKKKSKWKLPPFHQTSHTQAHSVHTHPHNDTPSLTCVLWFIHSCYLHFTLLTGHSLFDHGDQLSQVNWCSHINWKTSKVLKENRSFSGTDPFLPRGQLSELHSFDDSLKQKPGNRNQRKQATRRK